MKRPRLPHVTAMLVALALGPCDVVRAAPIPSKAEQAPVPTTDLTTVQSFLARDEVARALAAHGLKPDEVEARVAQLSASDLRQLAAHLDQVQVAGRNPPDYIWILLGVLLGVLILGAVF